jgi:CDP-diacylglycerol--serine O-phosphatidyltransferase
LAICAAAAVTVPYILIWVIIVAYLCHVPFAVRNQRWLAQHPEMWDEKPQQRRAVRRATRRAQPSRRPIPRLGRGRPGGRSMARLRLRKPGGRLP